MSTVKAIIFDMDGVLFDTEGFYYRRRETFLAEKGISVDHLPPSFFIGGNMKQVWHAILQDAYHQWDVPQLQAEYTAYKNSHPLPYKDLIFEDTVSTVRYLYDNGYRLALASSSTMHDIEKALDESGLRSYFSVVLSGEDFAESKPNPVIYLEAIRQLDLPAEDIVVIEDSEKGIAAGVAAGLEVWAIEDTRYGMNQEKASLKLTGLRQMIEYLES